MLGRRRDTPVSLYRRECGLTIVQYLEAIMPTKEDTRRYIDGRAKEHKPPPDAAEIRRQMGWDLVDATRKPEFPLPSEQPPKLD